MATYTSPSDPRDPPLSITPATDDVWVNTNTGFRQRWTGVTWARLMPVGLAVETSEVPPSGARDRHLVKRMPANWDTVWQDPAQGLVAVSPQSAAADHWFVAHMLGQQYVSVTVVSDTGKIVVPEVQFSTANSLNLYFAYPVAGTAFVRK